MDGDGYRYDAITLDVMLPNTDGFTLCRELRRQGVTTPVLMITALGTIQIGSRARQRRDDYLAKPSLCRTAPPAPSAGTPAP